MSAQCKNSHLWKIKKRLDLKQDISVLSTKEIGKSYYRDNVSHHDF